MSDSLIPNRIDYGDRELKLEDLTPQPVTLYKEWMQKAIDSEIAEPNAVCLCTADDDGVPDGRFVLLKGIEDDGLIFYTNYGSRKGKQLLSNPRACLVSWWEPLRRQIRVSGRVEKLSPQKSDLYFSTRPRASRLGAWASKQSRPIASRQELQRSLDEMSSRFPEDVPRPEHWGGFRLVPARFEFWQGRDSRLHDRFEYRRRTDGGWDTDRLMP